MGGGAVRAAVAAAAQRLGEELGPRDAGDTVANRLNVGREISLIVAAVVIIVVFHVYVQGGGRRTRSRVFGPALAVLGRSGEFDAVRGNWDQSRRCWCCGRV